ncbi:MAG: cytochrome c3 family protein, partial [Bauldia litoralis]
DAAAALATAQETLAEGREEFASAIDSAAYSLEYLTTAMGYLLGVDPEDIDSYGEPAAEFLTRSAEEGRAPLAEAIEERGGDPAALLAGLSAELVTRVTCAWVANTEYEPVEYIEPGKGWAAEEYQVTYMPTGHADAVTKGWIGFALASRGSDVEGAEAFRDKILDPSDGPGRCFKCHVAPEADAAEPTKVAWAIPREDVRPHTTFNHDPHLNVLEAGLGCATCHRPLADGETLTAAQTRPGPFANEFKPVEAATCAECHHDGGVRQDCGLCHRYHSDPSIRKRTM